MEVRLQLVLDERLDSLRAGAFLEVHAVRMVLVAALPVLPGHHRVVPELVEPRANQRIAALDLVVEEAERQGAVHRLDPERQAAKLHRERIEVHRVDAALHHVAAEHRLEARLEALVVRRAGNQLVTEAEVRRHARALAFLPRTALLSRSFADDSPALDAQQPHKSPLAVRLDAAVMLERGVERIGEKAKRGQGEGAGPAGGVAYRQRKDFLGKLRRPARGGRIRIGRSVGTGGRVVGERAQGTLHGGDGEPRGRV